MGLKKNILYSSILTTANYIFPLLVYPYVSRVLGVTNIGICNFVDSIIHYFILFSMMGVTIMGTREIAASKANSSSLDSKFSSIIALNAITTFIALIALAIATITIPQLWDNRHMMLYGGVKLFSNFLLIEWFYKGMEDFKYITMRTIAVKCIYVLSVFLFIKGSDDYPIYYLLTCLMVTGNAVINFIHARRFAKFKFSLVSFKSVSRPFFTLGSYMLITSMCTTFNVAYLGFATDETQVGYYTTATKLYSILLALFTGVTSVIMPRMSSLLAKDNVEDFKNLLKKTTDLLFSFSIPAIVFTIIFASQIIMLISGPGYEGAIIPMKIVMPMMLIIGYEQIIVVQGLMPLRKDKVIMRNSSIGAAVSLILNIILVSRLMSIGSAIVWICTEMVILILSQYALTKCIGVKFPTHNLIKNMLCYLPLACLLTVMSLYSKLNYWEILIASAIITALYTMYVQIFISKNPLILKYVKPILKKIR